MSVETLKENAIGMGFDSSWIADILEKYGPDILNLAIQLANNGFSVAFIVEMLQRFGPYILQFLLNLLNNWKVFGIAGDVAPSDDVVVQTAAETWLPSILERILPQLVEKYAAEIADALVKFLLDRLKK